MSPIPHRPSGIVKGVVRQSYRSGPRELGVVDCPQPLASRVSRRNHSELTSFPSVGVHSLVESLGEGGSHVGRDATMRKKKETEWHRQKGGTGSASRGSGGGLI